MIGLEDYFDNLFKTSCGWLGWEPEVVLTSNIGQLELALEGKIDFVKRTNPWGKSEEEKKEDELAAETGSPELGLQKLLQMIKRKQEVAREEKVKSFSMTPKERSIARQKELDEMRGR